MKCHFLLLLLSICRLFEILCKIGENICMTEDSWLVLMLNSRGGNKAGINLDPAPNYEELWIFFQRDEQQTETT